MELLVRATSPDRALAPLSKKQRLAYAALPVPAYSPLAHHKPNPFPEYMDNAAEIEFRERGIKRRAPSDEVAEAELHGAVYDPADGRVRAHAVQQVPTPSHGAAAQHPLGMTMSMPLAMYQSPLGMSYVPTPATYLGMGVPSVPMMAAPVRMPQMTQMAQMGSLPQMPQVQVTPQMYISTTTATTTRLNDHSYTSPNHGPLSTPTSVHQHRLLPQQQQAPAPQHAHQSHHVGKAAQATPMPPAKAARPAVMVVATPASASSATKKQKIGPHHAAVRSHEQQQQSLSDADDAEERTYAVHRQKHNEIELRRRERMKQHFQELDNLCQEAIANPDIQMEDAAAINRGQRKRGLRKDKDTILVNAINLIHIIKRDAETLKRMFNHNGPVHPPPRTFASVSAALAMGSDAYNPSAKSMPPVTAQAPSGPAGSIGAPASATSVVKASGLAAGAEPSAPSVAAASASAPAATSASSKVDLARAVHPLTDVSSVIGSSAASVTSAAPTVTHTAASEGEGADDASTSAESSQPVTPGALSP